MGALAVVVAITFIVPVAGCILCAAIANLGNGPRPEAKNEIKVVEGDHEEKMPAERGEEPYGEREPRHPAPRPPMGDDPPPGKKLDATPKPEPKRAAEVHVAPLPRRVANRPPEGFASKWARIGDVETRVVGAKVVAPILVDHSGREYAARERILLVWVETRTSVVGNVELRRWVGAINSAATLSEAGKLLEPVRFSGASVAGQIDRGVKLHPGDPPALDVLAFTVPSTAAKPLTLRLNGFHVKEFGEFEHEIPAEAWK